MDTRVKPAYDDVRRELRCVIAGLNLGRTSHGVVAGLDPATHPLRKEALCRSDGYAGEARV
jgi:hypothetical protein